MTHSDDQAILAHALPEDCDAAHGWRLHVFPAWRHLFATLNDVRQMFATAPATMLQANSRGQVVRLSYHDTLFIAKRALRQERRWWMQLTSLYRGGEGARLLQIQHQLYEQGVDVPEPVFVLERKRYGLTVASWSLYRYLAGEPCTCAQADRIAATLHTLHQHGWVHRDPHVKNFLRDGAAIRIIDCAKARPWRFRYAQMYDIVLLNNCCPGSLCYFGLAAQSWTYRLAKAHNNWIKRWRRLKRAVRSLPKSAREDQQRA